MVTSAWRSGDAPRRRAAKMGEAKQRDMRVFTFREVSGD
jgi:hypothetical protein